MGRRGGIPIGWLDSFELALLRPGAAQWRIALLAARHDKRMAQSPATGAALFTPKGEAAETGARISGFRSFAGQFMRMDIAERLVRLAHEKMEKGEAFTPEDQIGRA